jgi:hypothetical protein
MLSMGNLNKERKVMWNVRYSQQAQALLAMLKNDLDLTELEDWVLNGSDFGMIGDAHILAYIHEKNKICLEILPIHQP